MAFGGSLPQINLGVQDVTQGGHHKVIYTRNYRFSKRGLEGALKKRESRDLFFCKFDACTKLRASRETISDSESYNLFLCSSVEGISVNA
ncbi:hypothetical protein TNCV_2005361 [Trichonephila clavipes]|nr:hypothetical protein TNCV_2005361 [Trichonephila clavipes]